MSVTYGFYDSLNHDRTYSTLQFSSIFDGIISDGIYATYLDALEVIATDPIGMDVNVKTGRAWFNHTWTLNDSILVLTVENADIALPRIDTVVLEIGTNQNTRANRIYILKGTPASTPVPPALIHGTGGVYQYPLANIRVGTRADVTTNGGIRNEDIINRRGSSDTPFVTGLFETINVDNLITQWSGQFDRMFIELENQISQAASQTIIDGSVTTEKLARDAVKLQFNNVIVPVSSFIEDSTYEDYPYIANIALNNVTSSMIPEVMFGMKEATSGVFAPVSDTGAGIVILYANNVPESSISATIDVEEFLASVLGSGTMTFRYTTAWNPNPENYGIIVTGSPNNGDTIVVTYDVSAGTASMVMNGSILIPTLLCWKGDAT